MNPDDKDVKALKYLCFFFLVSLFVSLFIWLGEKSCELLRVFLPVSFGQLDIDPAHGVDIRPPALRLVTVSLQVSSW